MKLQIRWKDCDRSKAVESKVEEALETLSKYNFISENIKVEIVYYAKQKTFKTRINVHIKGKNIIRSEAAAPSIYSSVNLSLDKIEDQLRRAKTKIRRGK